MPILRRFAISGIEVVLSGRVDALSGRTLVDYKSTSRPNVEMLLDSYQWRCYMMMLPDVERFLYEVFHLQWGRLYHRMLDHFTLEIYKCEAAEQQAIDYLHEYIDCLCELHSDGYLRFTNLGRPKPGPLVQAEIDKMRPVDQRHKESLYKVIKRLDDP